MLKLAASTALALLVATGASTGRAEKAKKSSPEIPASMNKQFEWENRVVGPKEGLDKDKLARIQEQGRREDEARKKEPPKKVARPAGVAAAGSAALPSMDIEQPAAAPKKGPRKLASASASRQKDSLDNLLNEQGVKPYSEAHGTSGRGGLDNLFAADAPSAGRKAKKSRR